MIISFKDKGTEDIFDGNDTKKARKALPPKLHQKGKERLDLLNGTKSLKDLAAAGGPKMELHQWTREPLKGFYVLRVDNQFRLAFRWTPEGAADVHFIDYHKGSM